MNIVQTEKIREIPFTGAVTSDTGWVKRWFNDRSFGFITLRDGGEDVCINWKQLVGSKVLSQGDTVSCNTAYDNSKGTYKIINCTVTSSEVESKGLINVQPGVLNN